MTEQIRDARNAGPDSISSVGALVPETRSSFDTRYGRHVLLGAGGMGEVYLVRDERIGREVAMKVIHPQRGGTEEARRRFVREARVQGRLEHPSLVPVHDLGISPEGQPYFVMKRIRGRTIKEIVELLTAGDPEAARVYPRRRLLGALAHACLALDFAHQQGVVHRDIKPANLMLGDFGEVYVLDWGIAKVQGAADGLDTAESEPDPVEPSVDIARHGPKDAMPQPVDDPAGSTLAVAAAARTTIAEQEAAVGIAKGSDPAQQPRTPSHPSHDTEQGSTREGTVLGSPGYAAPEQLLGRHATLDGRADVYSMGVILFEVLTLERLHNRGESPIAHMMTTIKGVDARPSVRSPELDIAPELDLICARATAKDPSARYQTARELAEVLEAFLAGERDSELRTRLADAHEAAAALAAARALASGPDADSSADRREALRELGRALALRPDSPAALGTLMELLTRLPDQVPSEVAKEIAAREEARVGDGFRIGRFAYASWLIGFPLFCWMGVRDWLVYSLSAAITIGMVLLCFVGMRAPRVLYRYLLVSCVAIVMGMASRMLGPLIFVPAVLATNTLSFALTHERHARAIYTAILSAGVVVPYALELAGVLPASYAFEGGRMMVLPHAIALPAVPTQVMLVVATIACLLVPVFWASGVRDLLSRAEVRVALQSWQLRQLFPARGPQPDSPANGKGSPAVTVQQGAS